MKPLDSVKELAKKRDWSLQKVATEAVIGINSTYRWSSKLPFYKLVASRGRRPRRISRLPIR